MRCAADEYADGLAAYLREQGYDWPEERVRAAAPLVQEKIARLGEFPAFAGFLFGRRSSRTRPCSTRAILHEAESALAAVEPFATAEIEVALKGLCERLGRKPRDVFPPIRVAVTGSQDLARALREPGAAREGRIAGADQGGAARAPEVGSAG